MIKRKLSREAVNKEPYLVWNAFIDILSIENEDDLSEIQKVAHLAFWYDSEIQNGGHIQYFENQNRDDYSVVAESLIKIGAKEQAIIFEKAVKQHKSKKRGPIRNAFSFVRKSLEGEYDLLDDEYYNLEPTTSDYLEKYLEKNNDEFIVFEE